MKTENNLENTGREEISIGQLLKSERERRGISIKSLSETIKIREQLIIALENEEWDKLPARVLIKGFIRSYTIAVGCDTRRAIKLFEKCVPSRGDENVRPLAHKPKKEKGIYFVVIILLLIVAAGLYIFRFNEKKIEDMDTAPQPEGVQTAPVAEPDTVYLPQSNLEAPAPAPVKPADESPYQITGDAPVIKAETAIETASPAVKPAIGIGQEAIATENGAPAAGPLSDESAPMENLPAQPAALTQNAPPAQETKGQTLTATVSMRTWVKIIADDTPPKEYIFQPGATHSWTAEKGFYVTVGNAGGIEFSFNGKTINNLGAPGEVKKLRFPDDFQTKWEE